MQATSSALSCVPIFLTTFVIASVLAVCTFRKLFGYVRIDEDASTISKLYQHWFQNQNSPRMHTWRHCLTPSQPSAYLCQLVQFLSFLGQATTKCGLSSWPADSLCVLCPSTCWNRRQLLQMGLHAHYPRSVLKLSLEEYSACCQQVAVFLTAVLCFVCCMLWARSFCF